ncbi:hypothetical protein BS78_05G199900 [Paspalum vaginatum]|nr:hypothetical protein BS78_05G199900 [Paspalum vaginatum]
MELADDTRKRARASGGGNGTFAGGGPDRLSALPDCLLHAVMSFLKAREAVQTCVLSKRWRHLWRSMSCLDIVYKELTKTKAAPQVLLLATTATLLVPTAMTMTVPILIVPTALVPTTTTMTTPGSAGSILRTSLTVNLVLRCDMALLESFRLNIGEGRAAHRQSQAWGWLRRAMKFSTPAPHPSIKREGWTTSNSSWNLKRLHLCNVFLDNLFAEHVGSVCRSLQDLELDGCTCKIQAITSHSMESLVLKNCKWRELAEITSPTLKTLVIDGGSNTGTCPLVILAPAVAYLHLAVNALEYGGSISIHEMPSLDKASIHIECRYRSSTYKSKFDVNQLNLIRSLSNVKSLEVSGLGITVFGKKPTSQEFKNRRNLLLGNCGISDHQLRFFLNSSPNLERITLRHYKFSNYSEENEATYKLNESSSKCRRLDFRYENLKLEIIYI